MRFACFISLVLFLGACQKDFHFKKQVLTLEPDSTFIVYWNDVSYASSYEKLIAGSHFSTYTNDWKIYRRNGPEYHSEIYAGDFKSNVQLEMIGKNIFRIKMECKFSGDPYGSNFDSITADIAIPNGTDTVLSNVKGVFSIKTIFKDLKITWVEKNLLQYEINCGYFDANFTVQNTLYIRQKVRIPD